MKSRKCRSALLSSCAIAGALFFASAAFAQSAPVYQFDIPAQSLIQALKDFSAASSQQIVFSDAIIGDRRAPPLRGTYTRDQALAILLQGTGLYIDISRTGVIMIKTAEAQTPGPRANDPQSTPPSPDTAESDESRPVEKVVVTGSHIRGVAPAGQKVKIVDRDEIDRAGFNSVQDLVRSLPGNFQGAVQEDSVSIVGGNSGQTANSARSSAINLRGLGADSTLTLINGRRLAPGGGRGAFTDVSMIPISAIQRVEILADGASAIYGADAVGGVVNIILRKDYEGAETRVRGGTVTDGDQTRFQVGQAFGVSWFGGNLLLSGQYDDNSALPFAERDRTGGDLRPFGGNDLRTPRCNPGTLVVGGVNYAIPPGQDGTSLDPTTLVAGTRNLCSPLLGQTLYPDETKWSVLGRISQDLDDRFSLKLDAIYSERSVETSITGNNARLTVPSTNAFYVNPTGGTGAINVDYDFTADLGPRRFANDIVNSMVSIGLDINLGDDWTLSASTGPSDYSERQFQTLTPDATVLASALADSNPATAFNPFGHGPNTSPQTLARLRDSSISKFDVDSSLWLSSAILSGPVVSTPSGDIRMALGADYRDQSYDVLTRTERPLSNIFTSSPQSFGRNTTAFYGELSVPLVADENEVPGIHRLALSAASRYEDYSDFGSAFSPRIGVTWQPTEGLGFRGTWSESFKAPLLVDLDDSRNNTAILRVANPQSPTGNSVVLFWAGNNRNLQPETATVWSAGFDVEPSLLGGLQFSATYFDIDFVNRINTPPSSTLNPANGSANIFNPSTELRQQICGSTTFIGNLAGTTGDCLTAAIVAILDFRLQNLARARQRGVDMTAAYDFESDVGRFRLGADATYLFEYALQSTSAAPVVRALNTEGDPLRFRLRGQVGWSYEPFEVTAFINHSNEYRDTAVIPNRSVDAWTTVDLNLAYTLNFSDTKGPKVSLNVRNLFDEDPPFVLSGFQSLGFDPANANAQGRFVSLTVTQQW